ncbi:MAG: quinohemoprotein amine dehydrogenase subunit alpha [Gemmatimonadaceae bacterium]|nr:quinohemoprotein amine dehydrogenase subunit alpha [Gemmatimonadaceae bacterium]
MTVRHDLRFALLAVSLVASSALAQGGRSGGGASRDTTRGFVINEPSIVNNCTECHARDSSGIIQRLSYLRKTPEGWEMTVRRMASLNKVNLKPDDARAIVRYLSNTQGLAPAEVLPGRFDAERRMISYQYTGDATTNRVCRSCHSMGRAVLQRRTRGEWELLVATHRGLYPNSDFQAFRRGGPPPPDSAGAPQPMDVAIGHLSRVFPLKTPEWTAWTATMRAPNIEGSWFVSGTEAGKGAFFGRTVVAKAPGKDDEFTTRTTLRYARDGKVVTRTGKSIVYTGFQWRGRSTESAADTGMREVMFIEPGWQAMSGRWYKGGYDEIGMDVSFSRVTGGVMVGGVSNRGLKSNTKGQDLTIFGDNFPAQVQPGTLDFGPGVRVASVVRSTPDSIALKVDVDSGAAIGPRDVFVAGASSRAAVAVYDKVSRIKVTPLAGLARTGGVGFPKQYQQFDAMAVSNGADNKPDTNDDFEIGLVDATWSVEEYGVTYSDDDVKFVCKIHAKGFFTPALDGPNPLRSGNRNNIGDVWVVATWQPPEKGARPLRARAQLIVTVPLYVRFVPARTAP